MERQKKKISIFVKASQVLVRYDPTLKYEKSKYPIYSPEQR